ncbi:hypothetical protein [Actinomadura parmotrematis]|uniref:Uncharacterized protein n=1 Tax=Actinomadura parmotrematis TaxID=2864039 RepID=A0ABS7FKH8_9ACTN|nr:hypothetical protein [Actinomadura parmotrematis]MBW8480745.1 hypothetical protein [Actinomadura parmotrematis]
MSNNAAHEMSPAQARLAGRFAGNPGDPGMAGATYAGQQVMTGKELDPAVTGLIAWLPPAGGALTAAAIDRWTEAARSVLTLAYVSGGEE